MKPYVRLQRLYIAGALREMISAIMLPLEKFESIDFWLAHKANNVMEVRVQALNPAPGVAAEKQIGHSLQSRDYNSDCCKIIEQCYRDRAKCSC